MSFVRLKTDINGGFPLVLDDIRVLQGELNTGLMNYLENICPTDGAVWIRGGSFPVAFSAGISSGIAYISALGGLVNVVGDNQANWSSNSVLRPTTSTFNSAGLKTFQNGTTADTYELPRYFVKVFGPGETPIAGDILLNNWVYLNQNFNQNIVTLGTSVTVTKFDVKVEGKRLLISFALGGPAGVQNTAYTLFTLNNDLFDPEYAPVFYGIDINQDLVPITASAGGAVNYRGDYVTFEFPVTGTVIYGL
jgi:hypothetical protein